jgi:L,D-peptidoglycan transpeptidase YkuD (ErfK/YbiS/YcfS/YnhG family)
LTVKREGDGATPRGLFRLLHVLFRPDRLRAPQTALPVHPIAPDDGWCDDPSRPQYNQPVQLPFAASHERLWRLDRLYDIVVVMNHNASPAIAGSGSAVFLHLARPGLAATEGCVAVSRRHMLALLALVDCRCALHIG